MAHFDKWKKEFRKETDLPDFLAWDEVKAGIGTNSPPNRIAKRNYSIRIILALATAVVVIFLLKLACNNSTQTTIPLHNPAVNNKIIQSPKSLKPNELENNNISKPIENDDLTIATNSEKYIEPEGPMLANNDSALDASNTHYQKPYQTAAAHIFGDSQESSAIPNTVDFEHHQDTHLSTAEPQNKDQYLGHRNQANTNNNEVTPKERSNVSFDRDNHGSAYANKSNDRARSLTPLDLLIPLSWNDFPQRINYPQPLLAPPSQVNMDRITQANWGVYVGIGVNSWSPNFGQESLSLERADFEQKIIGRTLSVGVSRYFGNHFYLTSGIQYNQFESRFNYESISNSEIERENELLQIITNPTFGSVDSIYGTATVMARTTRTVQHYNRIKRISIPISFGRQMHIGPVVFGVGLGLNANLTQKASGKSIRDNNIFTYDAVTSDYNRSFTLDLMLESSMAYRVGDHYMIGAKWHHVRAAQSWSNEPNLSLRPRSHHLQLTLGYDF